MHALRCAQYAAYASSDMKSRGSHVAYGMLADDRWRAPVQE